MTRHFFSSFRTATLVGAVLLVPRVAAAQSAQDRTAAETLFEDGKRLMNDGKYSEACPKLEESNRIDPGAGTLTALALCHRGEGKTATAWSEFKEVISLARRDGRKDREQVAQENLNELEPKLSKITFTVDKSAQVSGLEIRLDASVISPAMLGSPLPADPGVHKLTVSAPGFKARESIVEVGAEHDDKTVTITPLEHQASSAATAPAAALSPSPKGDNATLRTTSYVVGGVGAAGVLLGIITGVVAASKHSDANCKNDVCPSNAATGEEKDARTMANISTVGFVAGGVLLAGGVVLNILSWPKKSSTTGQLQLVPSVSPQGGFGSIVGRF